MKIQNNKKFNYKDKTFTVLNSVKNEIPDNILEQIIKGSKERKKEELKRKSGMVKDILNSIIQKDPEKTSKIKQDLDNILSNINNISEEIKEYNDFMIIFKEKELEFFDVESDSRPVNKIDLTS